MKVQPSWLGLVSSTQRPLRAGSSLQPHEGTVRSHYSASTQRAFTRARPWGRLDSELPVSRSVRNNLLLLISHPICGYFAIAARTDKDGGVHVWTSGGLDYELPEILQKILHLWFFLDKVIYRFRLILQEVLNIEGVKSDCCTSVTSICQPLPKYGQSCSISFYTETSIYGLARLSDLPRLHSESAVELGF